MTLVNTEVTRLRDITRSKDPLHGLCQERLITPEACDWVKHALDPFHDQQLENLRGYPDVATEPTVVVKIRQAMTITKPPGLAAGEPWDCHIVLSPIDFAEDGQSVGGKVSPFGANGSTGLVQPIKDAFDVTPPTVAKGGRLARFDGCVANSVPSSATGGANLTFTPGHMPYTAGNGYECQNLHIGEYLDFDPTDLGVYRVIYSGFEVVNTTAQIYKQGAVTVYEYGNSYETATSHAATSIDGQSSGTTVGVLSPTNYFRCPPNSLAEAKIMPGSHSWAAQDGCYNTGKFQTENPFQGITQRPYVVAQNMASAPSGGGFVTPEPLPGGSAEPYTGGSMISNLALGWTGYTTALPIDSPGSCHFSRMNTTGAYFTGLSEQTTLFVTWRIGIERLPSANKPAFLALAQPSATFDPNALVLYNMVANILPPGCPQGYNDAGSWYKWIADAARKSIPSVYPVVRTAALMANAMGRPVLASALSGLESTMRPVAEDIAARRLQSAADKKRNARAARRGNTPGAKGAVKNWSQPTPSGGRQGGTNGLG